MPSKAVLIGRIRQFDLGVASLGVGDSCRRLRVNRDEVGINGVTNISDFVGIEDRVPVLRSSTPYIGRGC